MNRRDLLTFVAAGIAPLSLPRLASAQAAEGIEFGAPFPMSGPFAVNGKYGELGVRMAIQRYGSVIGRRLSYSVFDTEAKPATAVRKIQEAAEQKNAKFFVGGILSPEALAMGKEVSRVGGVFFCYSGADEITGKECNSATFRWPVPAHGAIAQTVRPLIEAQPKAKRWYTITAQYVFGEGMLAATKDVLKEKGVELVGNSYHSLSEKEFSGYLTNAIAAKPDVLVLLNFGTQSTDALRQAISFGLHKRMTILVPWTSGLEQFQSIGADLTEGIYFGAQYWHKVDAPANSELIAQVSKELRITPNYTLAGAYICTKCVIDAISKAGSASPKAVISALEGMKYDGLTGREEIRKEDHQVIKDYYLLRGKAKKQMKDADDYVDVMSSGKSFLTVEQAGCKLS
ncbi:ABC transporter substrate-binding protein [Variovorax boronicumulans]